VKTTVLAASVLAAKTAIESFGAQAVAMGAPAKPYIDEAFAMLEAQAAIEAQNDTATDGLAVAAVGAAAANSFQSWRSGDTSALAAIALAVGLFVDRYSVKIEQVLSTQVAASWNLGMIFAGNQIAAKAPLKKVWDSMLDKRVCSRCAAADRQVVAWHELFIIGVAEPPAHSRCRCVIRPWLEHWPEGLQYVDKPNEVLFDIA
jgi:hypothetical protein